jgi:undecaprenyl-diphosphatase
MKKLYLASLLTLALILLIIFIKVNTISEIDTIIGKGLYSLHDQPLVSLIKWVGMLGSTVGIVTVLFVSMLLFIIFHKNVKAAAILFLSVLIGNVGNKLLKALIERERPTFPEHIEDGFSFPSGHVMVGLLLFGMIAYYLVRASQTIKVKQTILICTSLLLILIGFSRLLEGEHFLTDVIGGFITGGLVLIGMISVDQVLHTKTERRKGKNDVAL